MAAEYRLNDYKFIENGKINMLEIAQEKGFSNFGEMFDAYNLATLGIPDSLSLAIPLFSFSPHLLAFVPLISLPSHFLVHIFYLHHLSSFDSLCLANSIFPNVKMSVFEDLTAVDIVRGLLHNRLYIVPYVISCVFLMILTRPV